MLQPAGRQSKRPRAPREEPARLDPIAMTLALWLGLVTTVAGMTKLVDDAAEQATLAQVASQNPAAQAVISPRPTPVRP